jgi:hypothetical protein
MSVLLMTRRAGGAAASNVFLGASLPRETYAPAYSLPAGTVRTVASGANLQTTLNAAQPGDVVVLEDGATWDGTYTLPDKTGSANTPIYVISNAIYTGTGVAAGVRATSISGLPRIRTNNVSVPALRSDGTGETGWRFVGIGFGSSLGTTATNCWVNIGNDGTAPGPNRTGYVTFDRCVFEGGTNVPVRQALRFRSVHHVYVTECSFNSVININDTGDCQCIGIFGTSNVGKIDNCFLGGATEGIAFGDGTTVFTLVSDFWVRRCYITHYEWQDPTHGTWTGTYYELKNAIEWKGGTRCLIEDCAIGFTMTQDNQSAIVIKSTEGSATVEDIIVRYIRMDKVPKCAIVQRESVYMKRIVLHNIVATNTRKDVDATENPIYTNGAWENLVLDKITFSNEATAEGQVYITGSGTNLRFTSCIFQALYGLWTDSGFELGLLSSQIGGTVTFDGNLFTSRNPATAIYVPNGVATFPTASSDSNLFENWGTQDLRLKSTSPYRGEGYLGDDPGADVATITTRTTGCITGAW